MADGTICMFNALWFDPDGGADAGERYLTAVRPLIAAAGGSILGPRLAPEEAVDGDFLPDLLFLGSYPTLGGLGDVVSDPAYAGAAEHRTAALADAATTVFEVLS